jgi:hypothetical protein
MTATFHSGLYCVCGAPYGDHYADMPLPCEGFLSPGSVMGELVLSGLTRIEALAHWRKWRVTGGAWQRIDHRQSVLL